MNSPKLYVRYSNLQETDNVYVLDNYLGVVRPGDEDESILDIGVGDGRFAVEILLRRLPGFMGRFLGCDISEEMLGHAREKYGTGRRKFVNFDIAADVVPVEFVACFDHIFSFYTMHWVQNQSQAFENIFKMLKPGGDCLLTFLASNPIYDIFQILSRKKKWKPYIKSEYIAPYHNCINPGKELRRVVADRGLICQVCKVERRSYTFPNMDICKKSVTAVSPFLYGFSAEDVDDYINDFVKEIRNVKSIKIDNINNNEEKIHIRYKLFVVHATKPK